MARSGTLPVVVDEAAERAVASARLDPTVKALGVVTLLNDLSSEVAVSGRRRFAAPRSTRQEAHEHSLSPLEAGQAGRRCLAAGVVASR